MHNLVLKNTEGVCQEKIPNGSYKHGKTTEILQSITNLKT